VGHTYAQLAAGFGVGTTTAYRYVTEAVDLLAALAPTLADVVRAASMKAYLLLGGTLLPIDRIAADRPFYCGKHKRHGMNVQVLAKPFGRLSWVSPTLPGAVHDVRAAANTALSTPLLRPTSRAGPTRAIGMPAARSAPPYWGRWETLSAGQQAVNRSHAKVRALVEQAMATRKSWRLLRKLRCSTTWITCLVQAVLTLPLTSSGGDGKASEAVVVPIVVGVSSRSSTRSGDLLAGRA
jgi:hypothetical protein